MTDFSFGTLGTQPFFFSPQSIPLLPSLSLSDDEKRTLGQLQARANLYRGEMLLCDAYYRGEQIIRDLGIAIPPELAGLRTLVGVPRLAVDPIVERSALDGFRMPGETDADQDLSDVWDMNGMDAELSLGLTDAKVFRHSFITVGSPLESGGVPEMCVESPLNMSILWDARSRLPVAGLQSYWMDQQAHAAVLLPNQTIHMAQNNDRQWVLTDRDVHNFGELPIARLSNRPRANMRDGFSAITPELRSITDAMCRTLLGLEVAREFYSVPQKLILGATEADFQNADGTPKSAWATYISRVLALERDEDGNIPEIHQFEAYDPSVFTKLIDMYHGIAAGILGVPAQYVGLYTQGNPVSADSAHVSESRLDRQATRDMAGWSSPLRRSAQLALRFMNDGVLPESAKRLQVDWKDPSLQSFNAAADGISKLAKAGSIPAASDVTLKRAGFSAVERQRLAEDRDADQAQQVLTELANADAAKIARTDNMVANDLAPTPAPSAAPNVKPAA